LIDDRNLRPLKTEIHFKTCTSPCRFAQRTMMIHQKQALPRFEKSEVWISTLNFRRVRSFPLELCVPSFFPFPEAAAPEQRLSLRRFQARHTAKATFHVEINELIAVVRSNPNPMYYVNDMVMITMAASVRGSCIGRRASCCQHSLNWDGSRSDLRLKIELRLLQIWD
jgi:hypothetical protein